MPTEETNDSAHGGAPNPQSQPPTPQGDGAGAPPAQPSFTTEQQSYIDRLVSERLERERKKQQAAIDKAKADAEAAQAAERGEFQRLYESEKAARAEAAAKLAQMELDQQRRDAAHAAGIPQLWQRLQGETAEELAEDAKALAAMLQAAAPANGQGRTASTNPTPSPQTGGAQDFVRQAIERQQKRATAKDPYEAMMKR